MKKRYPLILMIILPLLALLPGCASLTGTDDVAAYRETPVVTVRPPVDIDAVMIVPERALAECNPLDVPESGNSAAVLDTMLKNHGTHGDCMFKNDLKADYLRAADETQARVRIYNPLDKPPDDTPAITQ